jgi:hypothetical protein
MLEREFGEGLGNLSGNIFSDMFSAKAFNSPLRHLESMQDCDLPFMAV